MEKPREQQRGPQQVCTALTSYRASVAGDVQKRIHCQQVPTVVRSKHGKPAQRLRKHGQDRLCWVSPPLTEHRLA
jgi:hypothetical protein